MKKFILILVSFFIISAVFVAPIFAQTQNNNSNETSTTTLPVSQTIEGDYFAGDDRVIVSGTVNGDAYVVGGDITVDGTINGDLISGGGNITIEGTINGNVRVGGGNITFSSASVSRNITIGGGSILIDRASTVGGSIVAGGGNIQILSNVGRGITVAGGNVVIGNAVGGNIWAPGVGELRLSKDADVNGDVTYVSNSKALLSEGATVSGALNQEMAPKGDVKGEEVAAGIFAGLAALVFMLLLLDTLMLLIVGLTILFLFPVFSEKVAVTVKTKFGWSLLIGFAFMVLTPIIGVMLFITLVGIPIALFLFFAFIVVLWFGKLFGILALGRIILSRNKKLSIYWAYVLGIVVYFILALIPVIGHITQALLFIAGTGALLMVKKNYITTLRRKKEI